MLNQHFGRFVLTYVLPLLVLVGCRENKTYRYAIPEKTNDGWYVASLASEKIADEPIKNGQVIAERLAAGRGSDDDDVRTGFGQPERLGLMRVEPRDVLGSETSANS